MHHCANCSRPAYDKYCSHCGQKVNLERISLSYLWEELFHFFTHIDKGFLFTSWKMIVSPGKTPLEYVAGRRKVYQSPVSYFLIWITIYILFLYWLEKIFGQNAVINYKNYFGADTRVAISHLAIVLTIVIPFQAFYLWLLVTKKQYNYFETMVATIYVLGTIIMLQFLFAVISLLLFAVGIKSINLKISDLLKILYLLWFIIQFVRLFDLQMKWLRVVGFVLLAFGTFSLWRMYGVPVLFRG